MARPKVTTNCPANRYAGSDETIVEFSHKKPGGGLSGGLISVRRDSFGVLVVDVYNTDADVDVRVHKNKS